MDFTIIISRIHSTFYFYVPILVIGYGVLSRVYNRYFHLQQFKGPVLAGFSSLWLVRTYATGNAAQKFLQLNKQYGKLARIGPNNLITDDPEINFRILGTHSPYRRGNWFDSLRFHPHFTSIASETSPEKHDALRWKVSAGYTTKNFIGLEDVLDRRIAEWLHRLDKKRMEGGPHGFDLARNVRYMTLDAASYVCFSQDLMFTEDESDDFWDSIEESAPYAQYLSCVHGLFSIAWIACHIWGLRNKMILTENNNPGIGRILRVSRVATAKRFGPDAKIVDDMLGSWVKKGLSQYEAETEVSIALVTGAFPTASAINVTILYALANPRIWELVKKELEIAISNGLISSPVRNSEVDNLPYLQACINESLRLQPPIVQLRERVVPTGGETIGDTYIPGGTNIGINMGALCRNPCFGEAPETYRPERWIEADVERLAEMKRVHGLLFGYGSTRCLGIAQASMIINKALVEFLRRYTVEVLNPTDPWIDQSNGVSLHRRFLVRLQKWGSK
ncbi:eb34554e-537a-4da1-8134-b00c23a8627e [Sclerotinia trifoliorum]|uniref:Eb34554e-537a-4da1-8134-b00c23a8627e n=1 Tax=Sclerotinia trifoliorum TaxID=28548 RepID=A0A8H2ZTQ2_9HELO|nr:eb34554e-537a-4da1-8134-b00c23a8627e [Sclerotinia trifoliorum]